MEIPYVNWVLRIKFFSMSLFFHIHFLSVPANFSKANFSKADLVAAYPTRGFLLELKMVVALHVVKMLPPTAFEFFSLTIPARNEFFNFFFRKAQQICFQRLMFSH